MRRSIKLTLGRILITKPVKQVLVSQIFDWYFNINSWKEGIIMIKIEKKSFYAKQKLVIFAFVLPAAIFMFCMIIIPILYNLVMSFQNVDLMNFAQGDKDFIGLAMYKKVVSNPTFKIALNNTLFFTFWCLIFQFILGFGMALFFSKQFRLSQFLRGLTVVAWVMPMIAVAGIFKFMFNGDIGIINDLLLKAKIIEEPIRWLSNGDTAMIAIIIANIWKGIPFNMILLSTALTTLPRDVFEAASIDGANSFKRFYYITLPLLKPAIISVLTLGFIYTFKVFDLPYVMTGGGPGSATEMLSTLAYRYSFTEYNFSQGSTVANILFALLMIVGVFYISLVNKEEDGK